jgi:hypothetical protein
VTIVGIVDPMTNRDRVHGLPVLRSLSDADTIDAIIVAEARNPYECYRALADTIPVQRVLAPPLLRLAAAKGKK